MSSRAIQAYLQKTSAQEINPGFLAYIANLSHSSGVAPQIAENVVRELADQRNNLKLIASENFSSLALQLSMGNLLTDKYAEGYPYHRFYAGCDNVDAVEALACEEACKLFGCDHAYVQPHSGAVANLIAYWAILHTRVGTKILEEFEQKKLTDLSTEQWNHLRQEMGNQRLLGMDYYSGGHLTHGYRFNVSAQMFDAYTYSVNKETGLLDYDELEQMAKEVRPLILLAGYSAYPRSLDFKRLREIADRIDAVLMVDMAHFAGLVAGKVFTGVNDPIPFADVVTTTTHKTLRGPRSGMVLCREEFAEQVNKGCPLVIGSPLPHVMAATAVCLIEANKPEFQGYAAKVVANAQALAQACVDEGMDVATGGTDNHLLLINVCSFGINGRQAENAVRECGITLNRNSLPFDPNGPWFTSGLRVGTPAVTTVGMGNEEMKEIASILKLILSGTDAAIISSGKSQGKKSKSKHTLDPAMAAEARSRTQALLQRYPVYPELDLDFLKEHFAREE